MPAAQRTRLRHLGDVALRLPQRVQKCSGRLGRQVLVVVIVDLDHGRVHACAQAFDLNECEQAVGGRLAGVDAEVVFDGFDNGVGAAAAKLAGCLC